ncbi:MAG: type II toxin-antitoxin system Phd/YefM family antitoxin [Propionibacteriaceae bacterium]|jgi:hypothetical protein|nr:type II toxin-antitoxin system Phd/YefM family antitoxin [Propionibacteriaceae bacterium]
MPTVTMRELKQNPQAVVQQVLATAQPFALTSRGYDTGVVIQPAAAAVTPRRFVPGHSLDSVRRAAPLTATQAQSWLDDIRTVTDDDVTDPWENPDS